MRIALLDERVYGYANGDLTAVGGAERQQWLLSRALAAAGWHVSCGVRTGLAPRQRTTLERVQFVGLERSQFAHAWYRFIASEKADWVYLRGAEHLWGVAVELAKLAAARTIFAAAFDTDIEPRQALTRRKACWPIYAWGLQRTDRIFLQHKGQLQRLNPTWRAKAAIVPSIAGPLPTVTPHEARDAYVAWIGMLREPKRPDLLTQIARALPEIRFKVCGGPTTHRSPTGYGEEMVRRLSCLPNVEFMGRVSPDLAAQTIAGAAVLLSTSSHEGFPNTFLEAWSSGTPVVTLNVDPDSVIRDMRLGFVSGDVPTAAADIRALIESPETREQMAARARRHVETTHSTRAAVAMVEEMTRK
jgi:glycosyltransferase involved in cell wall biosynthesis